MWYSLAPLLSRPAPFRRVIGISRLLLQAMASQQEDQEMLDAASAEAAASGSASAAAASPEDLALEARI